MRASRGVDNARRAVHPQSRVGHADAPRATGAAQALRRAGTRCEKNPGHLTDRQQKLQWIAKTDPRLPRLTYSRRLRTSSNSRRPSRRALDRGHLGTALPHRISSCSNGLRWPRGQILASIAHGCPTGSSVGQHQNPTHHPHRLASQPNP